MRIRLSVSFIAIALQWYAHGLGAEEVVVYHSVNDLLARSVAERFEKQTGIAVRLVPADRQAEGTELPDRLIGEKKCQKSIETVQRSRTSLDRLPGSRSHDSLQQEPA